MHAPLSPATLTDLRRPRHYPAVSVLMPTHRREPDNAQDAVRLRNLLAEAKDAVQADPEVSRADRIDVVGQLDQAMTEVDLVHAEDGLAIFAAPGEHQVWTVDREVAPRVVLAQTFLTRNLIAAQAADQPFWVLAVAADRGTLWSGGRERVTEHSSGGFPMTRSLTLPDVEREERVGDVPSTFNDEDTRRFLREVGEAAGAVLAAQPRPLYVVAEAEALAALDDVSPVTRDAARVVQGGLAQGPAEALWQAVLPAARARAEEEVTGVLSELDLARGRRQFAAGVDEVWQSVTAGRAGVVAIEDGYRTTVRDDADHLVPAAPGERGSRDDIVDEIAEQALETGARVLFVPDGRLAEMGRIAAVLRY
ncbi:chemotaxis protein [Streptomyces sp. NPDC051976]|uniref:baeRF3 domain-containing protein n=1 Tax=Streptomyces sp. NPDC051976 TaxID=3154947 RepID=UPI003427BC42